METNELRKIAGEIFNYNPSFLKEELSCMIGPILSSIGLKKLMPNVSRPLSKEEISQRIRRKNLEASFEDLTQLEPWYVGGGHMRSIEKNNQNQYALGSYFEI